MNLAKNKGIMRVSLLWELVIYFLLFYVYFFQNAIVEINGAIIILNLINISFGIVYFNKCRIFKRSQASFCLVVFVFGSVAASLLLGVSRAWSATIGFRMIEYILSAIGIAEFCISHTHRIKSVMFFQWLSLMFLAFYVLFGGLALTHDETQGAESLNVNVIASYMIILAFCAFYLLEQTHKKIHAIILLSSIVFSVIIIIQTASRRGFLVAVVMIAMIVIFSIIPRYSKDKSVKKLLLYMVLVVVASATFFVGRDYLMQNTMLGERLSGSMTSGDTLRSLYQRYALDCFIENPVLGVGVGGLFATIGHYSHSLYFELISCTGIVGSLLFLTFVFSVFKSFLRCNNTLNNLKDKDINNYKHRRYILSLSIIYFLALLVSGYALVLIYDFYFYLSISMICVLVFCSQSDDKKWQLQT